MARRKKDTTTEAGDATDAGQARDERAEQAQEARSNSRKTGKEVAAAHDRLTRLENVLETARGKVRAEWKKLKEEGFNTGALKRARKDLREDPLDAQMDFESYLDYRNLLGMEDAVQAARQAEEREANAASVAAASISTQAEIAAAHDEGLTAGREGKLDKADNPYLDGSPKFLSWQAGWVAGQRHNIGAELVEPAAA